ncbi:sensor histidine kinase [Streptomyces inhibens]|uniref:sensor histidine kinase n=1 Tax=Streptomyces inhibens TaxID=2293571 RepID=UPI0036A78A37
MSGETHRRSSLARNIVVLTTAVATLAVLLTGLKAGHTTLSVARQQASDELGRRVQALTQAPALSSLPIRGEHMLAGPERVHLAVVSPGGTASGLAAPALDNAARSALTPGNAVSTDATLDGQHVLVEGRPARGGGAVVLTEPYATINQIATQTQRNLVLPLAVGMLGAALAGALLGRRLARPLVAAATTAHRLAAGERGLRASVDVPVETIEVAQALNTLDDALGHSENRQREFLLSVSHELRTPLTALQGYAEALADVVVEPGEMQAIGRTLHSETRRLDRFLGDLLDLARLEADDFRLETGPTDLTALIAQAAAFWTPRCSRHGVELRLEQAEELPVVLDTDGFRVRQLIDGLVENALRVTPSGKPLVLALHLREGGGVELQVRDSGPGLTEDDVRVAFDSGALHKRYQGSRPVGSGLGPAIAYRLAGRLRGTITATGHGPEGGASFTVALPPRT